MSQQRKIALRIYMVLALVGLVLIIAGYSFSIDAFNYILVGVLILTPVIALIVYLKKRIVRIVVSVLFLVIFCFVGYVIMIWSAFSSTHPENVKTWETDGYRIELTHRQGWAGPPYYQYDLKRVFLFGIFEKTIDQYYPGMTLKDTCYIEFSKHDGHKTVCRFDQCKGTIEE